MPKDLRYFHEELRTKLLSCTLPLAEEIIDSIVERIYQCLVNLRNVYETPSAIHQKFAPHVQLQNISFELANSLYIRHIKAKDRKELETQALNVLEQAFTMSLQKRRFQKDETYAYFVTRRDFSGFAAHLATLQEQQPILAYQTIREFLAARITNYVDLLLDDQHGNTDLTKTPGKVARTIVDEFMMNTLGCIDYESYCMLEENISDIIGHTIFVPQLTESCTDQVYKIIRSYTPDLYRSHTPGLDTLQNNPACFYAMLVDIISNAAREKYTSENIRSKVIQIVASAHRHKMYLDAPGIDSPALILQKHHQALKLKRETLENWSRLQTLDLIGQELSRQPEILAIMPQIQYDPYCLRENIEGRITNLAAKVLDPYYTSPSSLAQTASQTTGARLNMQ